MSEQLNEIRKNILKTGTSIVGIACKDGIVMAADRQVTAGNIAVNKRFQKVSQINDYLVVSWTGGLSDAMMLTKLLRAELRLKHLRSKQRPTVKEAASLVGSIAYNNIRRLSTIPFIAGTLVGGFNEDGTFELYTIEPAGSVTKVEDYDANFSSGMPYILGLLEREYNDEMTVKEGVDLALNCLKSSTQRDIGSGFGIDVFAITLEGIKHVIEQEITPEYKERIKKSS